MADTLAQKIRAKFPGTYDDLSDQDLEAKVTAKFPGVYDDIPRTGASAAQQSSAPPKASAPGDDAAYAKGIRAATRLTQAEFAARIGVPLETVRNWGQGKRAPRGPARALLRLIERAPDLAFAVLGPAKQA